MITEVHLCSGSPATGGKHVEIRHTPQQCRSLELKHSEHEAYQGDVAIWFKSLLSLDRKPDTNLKCWRNEEGISLCDGTRDDIRRLVVSLPIVLMLDIGETSKPPIWTFPGTLTPLTKAMAKREGLIYDLVGFGLHSQQGQHFIARYFARSHSEVYHYDGMHDGGRAIKIEEGKFATHLVGNNQKFPDGYHISTVIYHLRGGLQAQDTFFVTRAKALAKRFKLNISGQDLSAIPQVFYGGKLLELDSQERFWMNFPLQNKYTEYVTKIVPRKVTTNHQDSTPAHLPTVQPDLVQTAASPESEEGAPSQPQLQVPHQSPQPDEQSLPDSDFQMNCRCGVKGDRNLLYRVDEGEAVQCDECKDWSHIACQRDGRASLLAPRDSFVCDFCDLSLLDAVFHQKQRVSARK